MGINSKVSVILTSYNHEKYLREAIESVLNQSFSDFELIIWDDASTDSSWEIINSYTDNRIRGFRNETNSRGTINKSLLKARGEYIAIHHSDDIWEPSKLEKQVAFLDANPETGAVFTQALIIDENGDLFKDESHFYYKIFEQPVRSRYEWLNFFFFNGNALCHPSVLVRKKCYDECGPYRLGMAQLPDFDMWVRLCLKYEIHVLQEKLVRFRLRQNNMNASAPTLVTQIRGLFEVFQIYENFRTIPSSAEFERIFPEYEKYSNKKGFDIGFALGMIALDEKTINPARILFGLFQLFDVIKDLERAKIIERIYHFSSIDFIKLSGKFDVFSIENLRLLTSQAEEREATLRTLSEQFALSELVVQQLTAHVAELEQTVQILSAELKNREPTFKVLMAQIAELEQTVRALKEQQAAKEKEQNILLNQLAQSQEETLYYAMSKSWRITRPLRWIVKFFQGRKNV